MSSSLNSCQRSSQKIRYWACLLPWVGLSAIAGVIPGMAQAEVTVPQVNDTVTEVTQDGDIFQITGETVSSDGSNLFHTFQEFSLTAEQTALFLANPQIQNILGRVIGGNASTIDGTLSIEGGNANLVLLNPSGLLFGPNVQLDLPGSFTASTAAGVGFGGENAGEAVQWFYGQGANTYGELNGAPSAFLFAPGNAAGAIAILGPLELSNPSAQNPDGSVRPQNLALVGETVVGTENATLQTSGNLTVTTVTSGTVPQAIRIGQAGQVLQLELDAQTLNLEQPIAALSLPELLTGSGLASDELPASLNEAIEQTLARGDVRLLGSLNTERQATADNAAEAGNVTVVAQGDLSVGSVTTSAQTTGTPATNISQARAGNVTLESQTGSLDVGEVQATAIAQAAPFAGKSQAQGGAVSLSAAARATFGNLDSSAVTEDGSSSEAQAGDVTVQASSLNGADVAATATVDAVLSSDSVAQGGAIQLTSDGDLDTGALNVGSLSSRATQLAGNQTDTQAGNVTVTASGGAVVGEIDATADSEVSFGSGTVVGGDVTVEAGGSLQTGNLSSHAKGLASGRLTEARGGDITASAAGDIVSGDLEAGVRTGAALSGNQLQGGQIQVATSSGSIRVGDVRATAQAEGAPAEARAGSIGLSNIGASDAVPEQDSTVEFSSLDASASVRRVLALGAGGDSLVQPGSIEVRSDGTLRGSGLVQALEGEVDGVSATIRAEALLSSTTTAFSFDRNRLFADVSRALIGLSGENLTQFFTTLAEAAIDPLPFLGNGISGVNLPLSIPATTPVTSEADTASPIAPSADNASALEPGQITLQHRGGPQNLDFVVGEETANGTVGALVSGSSRLDVGRFPVLAEGGVADTSFDDIRIESVNTAPSINDVSPVQITFPEGGDATSVEVPFPERLVSDRDGDQVQFTIETLPSGTLRRGETVLQPGDTWLPGDRLTYTPAPDAVPNSDGVVKGFSVVASDGAGQSEAIAYRFEISALPDPGEPIEPVDPLEPIDPTDPTQPVDPTDPTNPTEPVDPTEPTDPVEPTEPVDPTGPTDPTEPVEPVDPTGPTPPLDPTDGAEPTEPTFPVNPGDPASDSPSPSNPGPGNPTNPDSPNNPVEPTDPSGDPTTPVLPTTPIGPNNPEPVTPDVSNPGPVSPEPVTPDVNNPEPTTPVPEADGFTEERVKQITGGIAANTVEAAAEASGEESGSDSGAIASNPFSDFEPTAITSVEEATAVLNNVAETAGVKPALVYVQFVPRTQSNGPDFAQREAQFTQALTQYLKGESGGLEVPEADSDELELLLVMPDGSAQRKRLDVTRGEIIPIANRFQREVTDPRKTWSKTYLRPAQDLHRILIDPIETELQAQGIENISFIVDSGLRSLPFAALHDGESFLVERYSMGLMPSLSLADKSYRDLREAEVLAMGASEFERQSDLPGVETELELLTGQLWQGKSFFNDEFTLANLKQARKERPFGIVHLATHGEFRAGSIDQSFIQLWDEQLRLDQLRQLGFGDPPVDLLVLSACRTAFGSTEAELGFAGLAIEAGVKSALGSLWHVSDAGTLALMTQFYQQLRAVPIKAEALRQAQIAMLQGETRIRDGQLPLGDEAIALTEALTDDIGLEHDLSHPYFWSAFTLVGNPW